MILKIGLLIAFLFVLAMLIPWRRGRVTSYRVEKLNSRQALKAVSIPPTLAHVARPATNPRLKAVQ